MLTSSCATSASICEKSGFTVPVTVVPAAMRHRAVTPTSPIAFPFAMAPSGAGSRRSVRCPVTVGSISTLRPEARSRKPVTLLNWQNMQLRFRSVGWEAMRCRSLRG